MSPKRPNIILFTTDQHRGDHLSVAGHPVVETPNVDSFVNDGAYFPNAYTEIPSTKGARHVMHSGRGNYDCGVIGYGECAWDEPNLLASVLARAGYHCVNVGWRNMEPRRGLFGFHHVIPHDLSLENDDYWEWLRERLGPEAHERAHGANFNGWRARPWHYEERFHPTNWTVTKTLEMIRKRDPDKPFFVWCSHHRPHSPYDPPQVYWDMVADRELPEIPIGDWADRYDEPNPGLSPTAWKGRLDPEQNRRMRIGYMGNIIHIDDQLGYLMSQGLMDDTCVLFTADHGDMMGDHHLHRKSYAFEGSARIPFLIKYPKNLDIPTGSFDQVVGLQDVMPTLLEIAGVEAPPTVKGRSVLKAVRGEEWRPFLHGEHSPCYSPDNAMHYLTDGKEKYIWYPVRGEEQFFDLTSDRNELKDLASDLAAADSVASWRNRLIQLLADRGDGFSDGKKLLVREPYPAQVGKA